MAKTFGPGRNARIMAQITGKAREVGPEEARVRTVMSAARKVATLERQQRDLTAKLAEVRKALRFERSALRAYIQADRDITSEETDRG